METLENQGFVHINKKSKEFFKKSSEKVLTN
jgi:hypothetical protein